MIPYKAKKKALFFFAGGHWGGTLRSPQHETLNYKSWQPLGKTLLKVKLLVGYM